MLIPLHVICLDKKEGSVPWVSLIVTRLGLATKFELQIPLIAGQVAFGVV